VAPAGGKPPDLLTVSIVDGLKRWQGHNKLKQAVLRLLARELTEVQIQEIRTKFVALDKSCDGFISLDELMQGMIDLGYKADEEEIRQLVKALDGSGGAQKIGYNEFISALIERRMKFERVQLYEAFKKLDVFHEGKITQKALQFVLKNQGNGSRVDLGQSELYEIMDDFVLEGDAITFDDFCRLFADETA
jgi:calcium-dependent protein kinase